LATPEQRIVVVRGDVLSYTVEFLRYLRDAANDWHFSGEYNAFQRESPCHHRLMALWNKPFLAVSSDHSQNGVTTQQVLEDWFDLTQRDFEPVFRFTSNGGQWRFGFGVGRTIHARYEVNQTAQAESIELTLTISFDGTGLSQKSTYLGIYERRTSEKTFKLRSAYAGLDRSSPIYARDFEDLADPFSALSNEKLMAWAFPGLMRIATGTDADAKKWLRSVLGHTGDTPETRRLLSLLATP
jgi:hypothetical protein